MRQTKKNTLLCVDLKTVMQEDDSLQIGRTYRGVITRDAEMHYLFEEESNTSGRTHRRNPKLYDGRYISLVRKANGRYQIHTRTIDASEIKDIHQLTNRLASELLDALDFMGGDTCS